MGAGEVSQSAIADAAEVVAEKIDLLLERATDAVLAAPRAGSAQWRDNWQARDTEAGRAALEQRARVKVAIAQLAGVDPAGELDRAQRAGVLLAPAEATVVEATPRRSRRRSERKPCVESAQLGIW